MRPPLRNRDAVFGVRCQAASQGSRSSSNRRGCGERRPGRTGRSAHHAGRAGQMTILRRECRKSGRIVIMGWMDAGTNGSIRALVKPHWPHPWFARSVARREHRREWKLMRAIHGGNFGAGWSAMRNAHAWTSTGAVVDALPWSYPRPMQTHRLTRLSRWAAIPMVGNRLLHVGPGAFAAHDRSSASSTARAPRAPSRGLDHSLGFSSRRSASHARNRAVGLDNNFLAPTGGTTVNPNTHQKSNFCARLHMAVGLALSICPARPGAAS